MSQTVDCNECGQPFVLSPKVKQYPKDVERVYLECPHCGTKFTAYYTDKRIRRLQQEQRKLAQGQYMQMTDTQRNAAYAENKRLISQLKEKLRKKYEN